MERNQQDQMQDTTARLEQEITIKIDNPEALEKLYREDKSAFSRAFTTIFKLFEQHPIAQAWNARLNFRQSEHSWGSRYELIFIFIASSIAWVLAKLPEFATLDEELFYSRNITFLIFPFLTAYFIWKQREPIVKFIVPMVIALVLVTYINLLPDDRNSNSILLACIHLPILQWGILGYAFAGRRIDDLQRRIHYLRFNGDLVVMSALIFISGIIFSGITLGLFSLIQLDIEKIYTEYIMVFGLVAIPLVSTYLVRNNPQLVSKISPIIARIFTPVVTLMLFIFLTAVIITGKYPYNDRDALMIFNALLIGVMALILFSVAEASRSSRRQVNIIILCCLSVLTIMINAIALFAIAFRIDEYGITPNRMAVLGANILIMLHLFWVTSKLVQMSRGKSDILEVEKSIVSFLPFYLCWALFVTMCFPILFGFH